MGIIHTAKKNIKEEIIRKRKIEIIEEKKRNNKPTTIATKEDMEVCSFLAVQIQIYN